MRGTGRAIGARTDRTTSKTVRGTGRDIRAGTESAIVRMSRAVARAGRAISGTGSIGSIFQIMINVARRSNGLYAICNTRCQH